MSLEIRLPPLMESRDVRGLAREEQAEHLLHPPSLEELDATRAQARALDEELAARIQEHVVLHLVREHCVVPSVELELYSRGQHALERGHERGFIASRGRHEVDAVGVHLDDGGPQLVQPGDQILDEGAAFARHAVGGVVVVPVPLGEGEVAVEGVDEDLEGLLERPRQGPLGGGGRLAGETLGRHSELAEIAEQGGEDAEGIAARRDLLREHERGIEGRDVHVEHALGHAGQEHRRVPARHRPPRRRRRHGAAAVQVFPHEQGIDLRRVATQDHGLITQGQGLGLDEVRRGKDGREPERLQNIVSRVGHEPRGLLPEDARDVFRGQIGAVRGGDAEVARHVLEAIGLEVARAHVVELGEDPGVHDVPAADPVAPVADGPLGDLHARGIAAEGGAVASPGQGHLVAPGPRFHVLEVEAKDVVPLDHVGIALADDPRAFAQEVGLVHEGAGEHGGEARRIRDGDGDDPVGLPRGIRELEAGGGGHLDVHGHAAQALEPHPEEGRAAAPEQELLRGIREKAIRRVGGAGGALGDLLAVIARLEALAPGAELGQPAIGAGAVQRGDHDVTLEVLQEIRVREEQEGAERLLQDARLVARARPDLDGVLARLEGEEPGAGGMAEEESVVVEGQREPAQLSRPINRCSSRRAATWRGSMARACWSSRIASCTLCRRA